MWGGAVVSKGMTPRVILWPAHTHMNGHTKRKTHIHTHMLEKCPGQKRPAPVQLCSLPPVVATMRDLGKKEPLEAAAGEALGKTLTVAQLDVCSDESVANCLSHIEGGRVDVLGETWQPLRTLTHTH